MLKIIFRWNDVWWKASALLGTKELMQMQECSTPVRPELVAWRCSVSGSEEWQNNFSPTSAGLLFCQRWVHSPSVKCTFYPSQSKKFNHFHHQRSTSNETSVWNPVPWYLKSARRSALTFVWPRSLHFTTSNDHDLETNAPSAAKCVTDGQEMLVYVTSSKVQVVCWRLYLSWARSRTCKGERQIYFVIRHLNFTEFLQLMNWPRSCITWFSLKMHNSRKFSSANEI